MIMTADDGTTTERSVWLRGVLRDVADRVARLPVCDHLAAQHGVGGGSGGDQHPQDGTGAPRSVQDGVGGVRLGAMLCTWGAPKVVCPHCVPDAEGPLICFRCGDPATGVHMQEIGVGGVALVFGWCDGCREKG